MKHAAVSLLAIVLAIGCSQPRNSPSPRDGTPPSAAAVDPARLLLRYECEIGPVTEPVDRSCFGPTISLYSDGTVIYRDATEPWDQRNGVRIYPGYRVVRLTPAGVSRLLDGAAATIRAAAADPGTPPKPDEPIGDPFYWNNFDLAGGDTTIELRPGRGPLPRHGAVTAGLDGLARQLGSWTAADEDRASLVVPYRSDLACLFVQRTPGPRSGPWPWPDLDAVHLGLAAGPDSRVSLPIDNVLLTNLIGDRGAWRGLTVAAPDGKGAAWFEIRVMMPDEIRAMRPDEACPLAGG